MRIVIFSDSLGRPRPDLDEGERTKYEDVYGYILKEHFKLKHEIDLCYIDSLDTQDAIYWSQRMVAFRQPDIVIFHLGINDAVPRLFKKNSRSILLNYWFRKFTMNIFLRILNRKRYLLTKLFPKTYTSPKQFRTNFIKMIEEIRKYSPHVCCYGISICLASEDLVNRSYNINQNIAQYNEILKDIFADNFIDINCLIPKEQLLINDGIHLTKHAHKHLAKELMRWIEKKG